MQLLFTWKIGAISMYFSFVIQLRINTKRYDVAREDELRELLMLFSREEFLEIWAEGYGTSVLCVMLNKTKAFLMYLEQSGDSGCSSRNSAGNAERYVDFKLANGQIDSYPENWTVEKEIGVESLLEYFNTGKRNEKVEWESDGE